MKDLIYLLLAPALFLAGGVTENCATWAYRQRLMKGGRVLVRRSHFADELLPPEHRRGVRYWLAKQVPHFCWLSPSGEIWQYTVKAEWREKWRQKSLFFAWAALWWYDGEIVQGDDECAARMKR
jgi:hypothetical protein